MKTEMLSLMNRMVLFALVLVLVHFLSAGRVAAGEELVTVSATELKELKAQIEALQHKFDTLSEKQVVTNESPTIPKEEQQPVSQVDVKKYEEVKKTAKKEKIAKAAEADATGTDPRVFF